MIKYYNVNGLLVPKEEAKIGINDLALLRAFGIFDYFRFEDGKPVLIEDHLDRFFRSAAMMRLEIPFRRAALKSFILELSEANGLKNTGIQMILTGGYSEDGFTPGKPNLLILQRPYQPYPQEKYNNGVKLILWRHTREIPEVKTINYITPILAREKWKAEKAWDILYHNGQHISETSRANFFIVNHENVVVTPAKGILKGINREHILRLARENFKVEERDITIEEVRNAKEAFISSSTQRVMPVRQVNDFQIGSGKPGPITKQLRKAFLAYLETQKQIEV